MRPASRGVFHGMTEMKTIKKLISANKGFLCFLLGMLLIRSAVADWYGVPSASMYPTLLIGDRIISNRLAYDVKLPFTDIVDLLSASSTKNHRSHFYFLTCYYSD